MMKRREEGEEKKERGKGGVKKGKKGCRDNGGGDEKISGKITVIRWCPSKSRFSVLLVHYVC
jgi:hypothetical protein